MTELSFLVDLLLNHKLPKVTRDAVAARIKEVEAGLGTHQQVRSAGQVTNTVDLRGVQIPPHLVGQPASTIAAMMRHEQGGAAPAVPVKMELNGQDISAPPTAPTPVAHVAQTGAASAALAKRQQSINVQISGKPVEGETRPRKW